MDKPEDWEALIWDEAVLAELVGFDLLYVFFALLLPEAERPKDPNGLLLPGLFLFWLLVELVVELLEDGDSFSLLDLVLLVALLQLTAAVPLLPAVEVVFLEFCFSGLLGHVLLISARLFPSSEELSSLSGGRLISSSSSTSSICSFLPCTCFAEILGAIFCIFSFGRSLILRRRLGPECLVSPCLRPGWFWPRWRIFTFMKKERVVALGVSFRRKRKEV